LKHVTDDDGRRSHAPDDAGANGHRGDGSRARLLTAAVRYVEENGISDLRLRDIATAIGTSHRMLIYHFGSREGLIAAIVGSVEQAQREFLAGLVDDPALAPADIARASWRRFADARLRPQERLFFEIYGQALQARPGTAGFLDRIVDSWVDVSARAVAAAGLHPRAAAADARLGVAVVRGLLLDLLAGGDRVAVDDAMERYIEMIGLLYPSGPRPGVVPGLDDHP
jgi:AcrR family transcriptional regulator